MSDSRADLSNAAFDPVAGAAAARDAFAALVAEHARAGRRIPDPAWGVFADGVLLDGQNVDGVYRIASMTKSFTAAVVLGLKAGLVPALPGRPALDLDAPFTDYIPVLVERAPRDSPLRVLTLRDALTMSAGIPTDDPWADRQEALDRAGFDELLASDLASVFTPGTSYAYSNLSYALLGRVIEEQTGRPYVDVAGQLAAGFGLSSSAYSTAGLAAEGVADRLVPAYRIREDGSGEALPISGPGAFSAIGGLFSTVRDVGRWMQLFLDSWNQANTDPWARIRRDMQQPLRPTFDRAPAPTGGDGVLDFYGYGLHHVMDPELGTTVYHSGGYPGYGSHMRWHPATGTAIVFFCNRTYGHATAIATDAFGEFLRAGRSTRRGLEPAKGARAGEAGAGAVESRVRPAEAGTPTWGTPRGAVHLPGQPEDFPAAIERWLVDFDDARVAGVFHENIDLDVPRAERIAAIRRVVERTGAGADLGTVPGEGLARVIWSGARATWSVRGAHGLRSMSIALSPLGRVQTLEVEARPEPTAEPTEPDAVRSTRPESATAPEARS